MIGIKGGERFYPTKENQEREGGGESDAINNHQTPMRIELHMPSGMFHTELVNFRTCVTERFGAKTMREVEPRQSVCEPTAAPASA